MNPEIWLSDMLRSDLNMTIHTDTLLVVDFISSSWYVTTFIVLKSGVYVILDNVDRNTNKINILEKYWALVFPDMK